jgi:hypothetical protein
MSPSKTSVGLALSCLILVPSLAAASVRQDLQDVLLATTSCCSSPTSCDPAVCTPSEAGWSATAVSFVCCVPGGGACSLDAGATPCCGMESQGVSCSEETATCCSATAPWKGNYSPEAYQCSSASDCCPDSTAGESVICTAEWGNARPSCYTCLDDLTIVESENGWLSGFGDSRQCCSGNMDTVEGDDLDLNCCEELHQSCYVYSDGGSGCCDDGAETAGDPTSLGSRPFDCGPQGTCCLADGRQGGSFCDIDSGVDLACCSGKCDINTNCTNC